MRIVQMLPTMSFGDAVSNDPAAIRNMILGMGYETEIYASNIDRRLPAGLVKNPKEMKPLQDEDILIYHGSTGDPMNRAIPKIGGRKMMRYHNITPPAFFHGYDAQAELRTEAGYREIRRLCRAFDRCAADSDYNRQELRKMGYQCPIDVCPIVIPFGDYDREPDAEVLKTWQGDGWVNLLFVGRIAPNKRQENVIRAFAQYHRQYNPKSRLFLVGSASGMEKYLTKLKNYAWDLGLAGRVIFSGQISFAAILAYYRLADVFLCMSEHEGFCVPLVEAMYFDTPIVALRSSAVPETLGEAGLLLDSSDPDIAAAAIDRVMKDEALRERFARGREKRLAAFRYDRVSAQMQECIGKLIRDSEFRMMESEIPPLRSG